MQKGKAWFSKLVRWKNEENIAKLKWKKNLGLGFRGEGGTGQGLNLSAECNPQAEKSSWTYMWFSSRL
jgi:hypothetical protein